MKPGRTPHGPFFLAHWRRHRGLSLQQLAEQIDYSVDWIERIERGTQPWTQIVLERCAFVLGCKPLDLLTSLPGPSFADWLKTQMAEAAVTNSYLAHSLGCTKPTIRNWLEGYGFPDQESRSRLAQFFQVDVVGLPGLPPALPRRTKTKPAPQDAWAGVVFR